MHHAEYQSPQSGDAFQPPPVLEPISEPIPDPSSVRLTVELYENERYSPRLGFTCRGLLINDRGMFSDDNGGVRYAFGGRHISIPQSLPLILDLYVNQLLHHRRSVG
jgi:hypothetical protein